MTAGGDVSTGRSLSQHLHWVRLNALGHQGLTDSMVPTILWNK
jgi:hypothetical protein